MVRDYMLNVVTVGAGLVPALVLSGFVPDKRAPTRGAPTFHDYDFINVYIHDLI
jgi:hypothetical protein